MAGRLEFSSQCDKNSVGRGPHSTQKEAPDTFSGVGGFFLGRMMGLEPTTSRATTWRCHQLSYILRTVAYLGGFEPSTYCLEGSCSIQLS